LKEEYNKKIRRVFFYLSGYTTLTKGDSMFINEYGDKNNPLILLLAPMMVSGEDLYQLMHPYFKHDYVQKPQEEAGKDEGRSISFPGADVRL